MTEPENAGQWSNRRLVIGLGVAVVVFLAVIATGYLFHLTWTGLVPYEGTPDETDTHYQPGKNLWDWLQLLVIPVALAVVGVWFNARQKRVELQIANGQRLEQSLATYIDRMQDLLEKSQHAGASDAGIPSWVRSSARARTVTAIRQLDSDHNGSLLRFLTESGLLKNGDAPIDLSHTDLGGSHLARVDLPSATLQAANLQGATLDAAYMGHANLRDAFLYGAKLQHANLQDADLQGAKLQHANLQDTDLRGTNLQDANLQDAILTDAVLWRATLDGANLDGANLKGAIITDDQLKRSHSSLHATMPDGRKFQGWDGQSYETDKVKKLRAEGKL